MEENKDNDRKEIFSERVRAGKRTYFFDVKATRSNDYYLTITESKRRYQNDSYTYEKHKIFLYKEDFNKFLKALNTTVDHVKEELLPDVDFDKFDQEREEKYKARENGSPAESGSATATTEVSESLPEAESGSESTVETDSESIVDPESELPTEQEDTPAIENELKWD